MTGVTFELADFVTGGPILTLPVMAGASWTVQQNRGDVLSCTVDLNDDDAAALDLRSSATPNKTVMRARNDDDVTLAWGIINDDREWNEDARTLALNATGILGSWLGRSIIGPANARTDPLVTAGVPNAALDTTLSGWSLGTIGKKLVAQRMTWPGAGTIPLTLPADEPGTHDATYLFTDLKMIGSALTDLSQRENGPDFAFDCARASNGLSLVYAMRHGSEAQPRLGVQTPVADWALGGMGPITDLKAKEIGNEFATDVWMKGGGSSAVVLSHAAAASVGPGYPPLDFVDTSHNDVSEQATLDSYAAAIGVLVAAPGFTLSFSVRADATPALGAYGVGDVVRIAPPAAHPFFSAPSILVRITSLKGDETGLDVAVGCEVIG